MKFGTVAILGPGLIGGSLALALTERQLIDRLVIYSRTAKSFAEIRAKLPQAECVTDVVSAVQDADLIVLCVPIEQMELLVGQFRDSLKPGALVTDVGSVKVSVDRALSPLLAGRAQWVGSHPMAGSERSGFSAARADLFQAAPVIVTPTAQTANAARDRVVAFWQALGAEIFLRDPAAHDLAIAGISHLPHLVAALLCAEADAPSLPLAGGGFRDTTRVAGGSPELWTEILWANRDALQGRCQAWSNLMARMRDLFLDGGPQAKTELLEVLKKAQTTRSLLPAKEST